MDLKEFHIQLAAAPVSFRHKLRDYLRHPTERNACYITGYVSALKDMRLFKTEDATSYWLALIDRAKDNTALGYSLITNMDNPPAGDAQAALEAAREQQKELNSGIERSVRHEHGHQDGSGCEQIKLNLST